MVELQPADERQQVMRVDRSIGGSTLRLLPAPARRAQHRRLLGVSRISKSMISWSSASARKAAWWLRGAHRAPEERLAFAVISLRWMVRASARPYGCGRA